MRRMMWMFVVMAVAGGCAGGPATSSGEPDGRWELTRLGDIEMHEGIPRPTLLVRDGTVGGFAGVNRFSGSLASEGPFLFTPLATTRMAGPPPAMELETRYLAALQQATAWKTEGDALVLSADGIPVLSFRRTPGGD